jgi:hypothetical protein
MACQNSMAIHSIYRLPKGAFLDGLGLQLVLGEI